MNPNKKDLIIVGNKIYAFCCACGKLVRINKPIIGSMHACAIKEEGFRMQKPGGVNADIKDTQKTIAADNEVLSGN